MSPSFHQVQAAQAECYVCGEVKPCNVFVADIPDPETGYVDEYSICEECEAQQ